MTHKLTLYEKYLINQIELGLLSKYLGSILSYPEKRRRYYITIDNLKRLEIVFEMSNELCVNSSSPLYKQVKFTL
jgi:hypothetical protein